MEAALAYEMAATRFNDHVNGGPGFELELFDCRGDQADNPFQTGGTDDGLGLVAVGDDPLDDALDLVAGADPADRRAGEQDVVGADLDQKPRPDRTIEERDDQLGAVVECQVSRASVWDVLHHLSGVYRGRPVLLDSGRVFSRLCGPQAVIEFDSNRGWPS